MNGERRKERGNVGQLPRVRAPEASAPGARAAVKKERTSAGRRIPPAGDGHLDGACSAYGMIEGAQLDLLIVDDHAVVREGLEAMLASAPGISRIVTAASVAAGLQACTAAVPAVILLDLRMPGADGFSALAAILPRWPAVRIIMLSASATAAEVALARRNGAAGYLSKTADRATLLRAIQQVAAGGTFFVADPQAEAEDPHLSARELEVLHHLGRGLSNDDLGQALGISGETIKSHTKAIFTKLRVAGRAEAVARAYELGLMATR
jgi:DNA-binding NarL/FixJ family response regulator